MAVLMLLALPGPAAADGADCASAVQPTWTSQEAWVWNRLCQWQAADLDAAGTFGTTSGAGTSEDWPDARNLRSEFLETILGDPMYSDLLGKRGLIIAGARFPDEVNLDDMEIAGSLYILKSRFDSGVSFDRTKFTNSLGLDDSYIGSLSAYGSQLEGDLELNRVHVASDVNFDGAHVKGTAGANSIRVDGKLDFQITVDNALLMNDCSIGERADFVGSQIGPHTELRDCYFSGDVDLGDSKLGGPISLTGSAFSGNLSLSGARIDGILVLAAGRYTTWYGDDQSIDLTGATVQGLEDSRESWPPKLFLSGFTMEKTREYGINQPSFIDRDGDWYVRWLSRDRFSPATYAQLENLLRSAGRTSAANKIGMARVAGEDSESGGLRAIMSPLSLCTIGYGYHPEWISLWVLGVIFLGAVVACWLPDDVMGRKHPFIFSASRLVPIISLGKEYESVDMTRDDVKRWVRHYFLAHSVIGWVLAAILVAAVTVITSTGLK